MRRSTAVLLATLFVKVMHCFREEMTTGGPHRQRQVLAQVYTRLKAIIRKV